MRLRRHVFHSVVSQPHSLHRLRNRAKLSQDALAVKATVTKRYVQMIEAGLVSTDCTCSMKRYDEFFP